jgi:hypothetical protein
MCCLFKLDQVPDQNGASLRANNEFVVVCPEDAAIATEGHRVFGVCTLGHGIRPGPLEDPVIAPIAARVGKPPAQVLVAWAVPPGTTLLTTLNIAARARGPASSLHAGIFGQRPYGCVSLRISPRLVPPDPHRRDRAWFSTLAAATRSFSTWQTR